MQVEESVATRHPAPERMARHANCHGYLLYDFRPITEQPMAKDIDNPCVSLCQLNSELCVSCGRTREEIRKWRGMKRPEKMATVQRAATRMKAINKKNAKSK